eukprot:2644004-Rhodomonas_salina.1
MPQGLALGSGQGLLQQWLCGTLLCGVQAEQARYGSEWVRGGRGSRGWVESIMSRQGAGLG